MLKSTIKNIVRAHWFSWWSWSLSAGRLHSHSGNAHWERIPWAGTTGASVEAIKPEQDLWRCGTEADIHIKHPKKWDNMSQTCWGTHIDQLLVFFTVLEKIKNRLHIRLLQDKRVRVYREDGNQSWQTYQMFHYHISLLTLPPNTIPSFKSLICRHFRLVELFLARTNIVEF